MLVLSLGEMAEWLKALVLKVLAYPINPANTGVPPMFDIGFFLFRWCFDGRNIAKDLPSDLRKIGWQPLLGNQFMMAACIFQTETVYHTNYKH